MPHGLVHAVLNIDDTVAITENYLFVDALPGKYHILHVQDFIWPKKYPLLSNLKFQAFEESIGT